MKKSDLKVLINECIHEVLAEETANKKTKAINEIKRIIAEEDIEEEDLEEIFGLGKKDKGPVTDAEIDTWLSKRAAIKKAFDKMDPAKASKWKEFVKKEFADSIRKDEPILNVKWDEEKQAWAKTDAGGFKGFMGTLGEQK